ncbi:MAG: glycosyltransferase [Pyrinomonadaceae bacterium]
MNERSNHGVRKNVLHLIPSFHQGGSERQALQLVKLLLADDTHNIQLACLNREGILLEDAVVARFDDIPEFPLTSFYDANMAAQLRSFVGYLRSNEIDIIQTHDFYSNIFGMIGSRIARVPLRIAAKRETGMRTRVQRFIERRAFGWANCVVANCEKVRRCLTESGVSAGKIEVVYNGIDAARFDAPSKARAEILSDLDLPVDRDLKFVTIVANLRDRVKNHEMFLRAAKRISDEISDAAFIVAGEGERMPLIQSMAEDLGIAGRVYFLGRCRRVPELLAISDVCVLTSDSEGFSNSILEYMAAGKPVVATNVGGAAEAIADGVSGFVVSTNDDEALAIKVCSLLNDASLREAFGREGRRRANEGFSTANLLSKTLGLYERCPTRRRR